MFLAREKESKKDVAIKVMFLPHFCERGIQDQLRDEIQVGLSQVSDQQIHSHLIHNRITRVYGCFFDKDRGRASTVY